MPARVGPPSAGRPVGAAVTAALTTLGAACLMAGVVLVAYSALTDIVGGGTEQVARSWTRPVLLIPLAVVLIFLGGWLLRT